MSGDILIVEDQAGIRMLLYEMLSHAGYKVCAVSNGKKALEILEKQTFGLIISDYHLPMMNAAKVLREFEKKGGATPVILMSGMTEQFTDEDLASTLIKHVVSKPFEIKYMLKIVKAILSR